MSILNNFASISPEELREEVKLHLQWAYAHNHISIDELEKRLDILHRNNDKTTLLSLVEDLPARNEETDQESSFYRENHQNSDNENDSFFTILGSHTRKGEWDVPRKVDVAAILGSQLLDFREARFAHGTTVIHAFTFMGSVEMKFPSRSKSDFQRGAASGIHRK